MEKKQKRAIIYLIIIIALIGILITINVIGIKAQQPTEEKKEKTTAVALSQNLSTTTTTTSESIYSPNSEYPYYLIARHGIDWVTIWTKGTLEFTLEYDDYSEVVSYAVLENTDDFYYNITGSYTVSTIQELVNQIKTKTLEYKKNSEVTMDLYSSTASGTSYWIENEQAWILIFENGNFVRSTNTEVKSPISAYATYGNVTNITYKTCTPENTANLLSGTYEEGYNTGYEEGIQEATTESENYIKNYITGNTISANLYSGYGTATDENGFFITENNGQYWNYAMATPIYDNDTDHNNWLFRMVPASTNSFMLTAVRVNSDITWGMRNVYIAYTYVENLEADTTYYFRFNGNFISMTSSYTVLNKYFFYKSATELEDLTIPTTNNINDKAPEGTTQIALNETATGDTGNNRQYSTNFTPTESSGYIIGFYITIQFGTGQSGQVVNAVTQSCTVSDFYLGISPESSFNAGYQIGEETGYNNGFTVGQETGYNEGFDHGYNSGYNAGLDDGNMTTPSINTITGAVQQALNTPLIGNIALQDILNILIAIALALLLLKLLRG